MEKKMETITLAYIGTTVRVSPPPPDLEYFPLWYIIIYNLLVIFNVRGGEGLIWGDYSNLRL